MKYVLIFGICSTYFIYLTFLIQVWYLKVVFANIALSFMGIAFGFAFFGSKIFPRTKHKNHSFLSYLIYWPYHCLSLFSLWIFCRIKDENIFDEIIPGLYLGRKLWKYEMKKLPQNIAVLNVTAEFNNISCDNYECIPILDNTAPTLEELQYGISWIAKQNTPVYVHCAVGHSRSTTFVVAYLLYKEMFKDVESAVTFVQEKRQSAHPKECQMAVIEKYLYSQ